MSPGLAVDRGASMPLSLPRLSAAVPRTVVPGRLAAANAAVSQFLLAAEAFEECDIPATWSDSLRACEQALENWMRRQMGSLHCLRPGFGLHVLDGQGGYLGSRGHGVANEPAAYCEVELYWCEMREQEWPVGEGLTVLEAAAPGLGSAVLRVLREQSPWAYPLFTPDIACDVASYVYWCGEADEDAALDMHCGEDAAEREAMRDEMVTRAVLDEAYPEWARCGGARGKRHGRGPCKLREAVRNAKHARTRQIATDALALSQLRIDDRFRPDIEGEFIGFGAVLSWSEGDVTTRIYDDLLNLAHQSECCDRMGECRVALADPDAMGACLRALRTRFKAIRLIDTLIHQLSA